MLTELARQVGLAVHNARLDTALATTLDELRKQADELRQSRARIVASANAERRKVERDLHDGAQQHLVALAVNLRLLRDIVSEDPQLATEMLDQLADEVKATIQELRVSRREFYLGTVRTRATYGTCAWSSSRGGGRSAPGCPASRRGANSSPMRVPITRGSPRAVLSCSSRPFVTSRRR